MTDVFSRSESDGDWTKETPHSAYAGWGFLGESMKANLQYHLNSIASLELFNACEEILRTPEFFTWPASLSFHHAYEGGLLAHTVEVCDIAFGMSDQTTNQNQVKPWANHDILIAAALWHDFMKVREYRIEVWTDEMHEYNKTVPNERFLLAPGQERSVVPVWVSTNYGSRVHHIPGSAIEFTVAARKHGVAEDIIEQVQHCILAHHGRKEWGSPVEPQTIEALILHQADMTSAKFGATKDSL